MRNIQLIFILLFLPLMLSAQQKYAIDSGSSCTITGTSSIHSWTAKVNKVEGKVVLDEGFVKDGPLPKVGAKVLEAELSIPVKGIDGGKGETMNDKIFKAFDETTHPNIIFQLAEASVTSILKSSTPTFEMEAKGTLTMAGTEKPISLTLEGISDGNGGYVLTASKGLKMTDFEIEPPTAMFGQIVAGNDVTVSFRLVITQ